MPKQDVKKLQGEYEKRKKALSEVKSALSQIRSKKKKINNIEEKFSVITDLKYLAELEENLN